MLPTIFTASGYPKILFKGIAINIKTRSDDPSARARIRKYLRSKLFKGTI